MEFFELGIGRIHQLISDCFYLAAMRGIWFGLSSLILAFLLLFLCKKFNLFKRESRAIQIITHSYNIYIPLVFLLGGFAVGASLATKDFFAKETKNSISPLMKLVFPAYQSHVNTHWDRVVQTRMTFNQTVDEYVNDVEFAPRNEEFFERISTQTANFMVPKITRWGIESIVAAAKDIFLKQSEEQGYIETSKVKALLIAHSLSMFNYPPGIWEEANTRLEEKLVYFFSGIAGNIFLVFLVFLLFPVIETILHFVYFRKKINKVFNFNGTNDSGKISQNGNHEKIVEEFERVGREKTPVTTVDIEIPKVFEN